MLTFPDMFLLGIMRAEPKIIEPDLLTFFLVNFSLTNVTQLSAQCLLQETIIWFSGQCFTVLVTTKPENFNLPPWQGNTKTR